MIDINTKGRTFNIQRYSIADGPGIRTTVFVKGCPLSCKWCSNPESQSPERQVAYRNTSCKACGKCVAACPKQCMVLDEDGIHIDREVCDVCGACIKKCLPGALSYSGKDMTALEAFKVVMRDKDYYEKEGGCTCSGGEILMQPDFVAAVFAQCRENGIHTNADTSGFGSEEAMRKILEYADMVFFDLKHMDPEEHKRMIGVSNELILKNLDICMHSDAVVVIRVPLIKGYNDTDENIIAMCETLKKIGGQTPEIQILPYHNYGENKYRMIDEVYELEGMESPSQETKDHVKELIESMGFACKVE